MPVLEDLAIKRKIRKGVLIKCPKCGGQMGWFDEKFNVVVDLGFVNIGGKIVGRKEKQWKMTVKGVSVKGLKCKKGHKYVAEVIGINSLDMPCPNPICKGNLVPTSDNKLKCSNEGKCKVQLSKFGVAKKIVDAIDEQLHERYITTGLVFNKSDWAGKINSRFLTPEISYSSYGVGIWNDIDYFSKKYGLDSHGYSNSNQNSSSERPLYQKVPPYRLPGYWVGKRINPPPGIGFRKPPPPI